MSLISSMYTAANGLQSHSDAMGIVSDNISNINTIGFKEASARFVDVMAKAAGGIAGNATLGQGSRVDGVEQSFAQGALLSTGGNTDLALEGDGFFVVNGSTSNGTGTFYSRSGQFKLDPEGRLINYDGLAVQGYSANAQGTIGNTLGNIQVQTKALIPPLPTSEVNLIANLNPTPTAVPAFNATSPSTTSHFSTAADAYDSLGTAHKVQVYFRNSGAGAYDWYALVDGGDLTGGTAGVAKQCATGSMTFTPGGKMQTQTTTSSDFDFLDATQNQVIAFDFGDPIGAGGSGTQGVTSYEMNQSNVNGSVTGINADGYSSGAFSGISFGADGTISGSYTNGSTLVLGQLAVAKFPSVQGIQRVGQGLFSNSATSGQPAIGAALTGGRGSISSGSLEQSNVNLSNDFIQMMAYQRGFQANSRTVHTSDSMLQELVNLGR